MGPNLPHGTVPGAPFSDGKTFFGLHLHLARTFHEYLRSAKGPGNVNRTLLKKMVSKRNRLLYHFSITIHLHLASFSRKYIFEN